MPPPAPTAPWQNALPHGGEDACGYAILDSKQRLSQGNDALRNLARENGAALRPGAPLPGVRAALIGSPPDAGDFSQARTILRHPQRRAGRPVDFHTEDRRKLQISLHRPEFGASVLRVADVTHTRLLQAHVDRQTALLRLLGEIQTTFLTGSDHLRAFSRFLDSLLRIASCHSGLIATIHGENRAPEPLASIGAWGEAITGPMPPILRRALTSATTVRDETGDESPGLGNTLILPVTARARSG